MKVLIIGGDRRMLFAKAEFERRGYAAATLGLCPGDICPAHFDTVVLSAPVTRDGVNINCPLADKAIPLSFLNEIPAEVKVFGGGKLDINNYTDYLSLDEFALENAALTAEGAISYAISATDFSLYGSDILVIGYGRTGRVLTDRLKGFAPRLTVSARSGRDFAALNTVGVKSINTLNLKSNKQPFDIVFNTVDIKLSDAAVKALGSPLFIDISSRGGIADTSAADPGLRYVKLPGIPGKTAPRTAGIIIAGTVINLLGQGR